MRRTGRHAADGLPAPGPQLARRLAVAAGVVRPHPLPLVSIVVPAYDVEDYLAECLDSLIGQTHDNLQLVLVDDESPDRSFDIMAAYARRDRRIEIIRQPHAGVAAARNAGVREARGTFLMFVDADDTLDAKAVATHVASLRRTRSDFSVAPYRRFDRAGTWAAGWWINQAHATRRERVTLRRHPDIQVNAVVWSKCFRRRFWEQHGLAFPEGVLYEDQVVSSRAYALARAFDILSTPVYNWRVREDQTSITQQVGDPETLRARLAAAKAALEILTEQRHELARDVRLVQFLRHDLRFSIRAAQHADDEYWSVLRQGLVELTSGMGDLWSQVSVQQRIAINLVVEDLRAETTWFTGLGRSNPKRSPALVSGERLYLESPARHILGVQPTDPVLAFAPHQLGLVTSIRRLHWTDDSRLQITAWAYLDNVSLADPAMPVVIRVWAELRGKGAARQPVTVPLTVTPTPSPEVTATTRHRYADYERSVFVADLDPRALTGLIDSESAMGWRIMVEVTVGGIRRSGSLREPYRPGSAGGPTARFFDDLEVVPRYGARGDLRLHVGRIRCVVESAGVIDRVLSVQVHGLNGYIPHEIEITFPADGSHVRQPLERSDDGQARGDVVLPQPTPKPDRDQAVPAGGVRHGLVRFVSLEGIRSPAAVLDPSVLSQQRLGAQRADQTEFGNLCVTDERRAVRVQRVRITPDQHLHVSGVLVGLHASDLSLGLSSAKAQSSAPARSISSARFEASIALQHDAWLLGRRPLPSGNYVLTAQAPTELGAVGPVVVHVEQAVIDELPILAATASAQVRLRRISGRRLQLDLSPPLGTDERGARPQQRMQNTLRSRLTQPRRERNAVLFRSNYGEIAGCNQLAVHQELVRRGRGHTLYWAVKDYSVVVPEGGIPVIHDSAEWYRLLHEAEYYLDNMHQPIYHRKPAHQVQVQTFHGYPFKQMGLANWARQRREVAHVESYVERAADWNFVVSPARYATQPLRDAFGFPHEMLEIGYPRNDALLRPGANRIAAAVRERLGIGPDQTAILYAPTFREELAQNDFTAAMVDFLDVNLLAAALGPSYVVLVRGHAFNARTTERIGSAGRVLDVTDYPNAAELILASDAAVLDYSSIRFDYGLTDKPMIFLVPDMERYLSVTRGGIMPYQPTAPGPLLRTTDDVIAAVTDLSRVSSDWAAARARFRERFLDLDDGHAAERLVDRVFFN